MYSLASDVIQLQQSKSEYLKRDSANESHDLKRDSANKRQLAKSRNDMLVQQKKQITLKPFAFFTAVQVSVQFPVLLVL